MPHCLRRQKSSCPLSSGHLGEARCAYLLPLPTLAAERVPHAVRSIAHVPKRENAIVNRLNKTKVERVVDHEAEKIERVKSENAVKRAAAAVKVRSSPPRQKDALVNVTLRSCRKRQISSSPRPARPRRKPVRTTYS